MEQGYCSPRANVFHSWSFTGVLIFLEMMNLIHPAFVNKRSKPQISAKTAANHKVVSAFNFQSMNKAGPIPADDEFDSFLFHPCKNSSIPANSAPLRR
jgi:hypothetical protein